jgi:hypothetical protein
MTAFGIVDVSWHLLKQIRGHAPQNTCIFQAWTIT